MLVSKTYAVYHATDAEPVQDDNIMIRAGVRSTEHLGYENPFNPDAQCRYGLATHAGSVSYILGKSYIVNCEASMPDSNGMTYVTCKDPSDHAGIEFAKFQVNASGNIAKLREIITKLLNLNRSDTSPLQLKLLATDGTLLSDTGSIEDAFALTA